MTLGTCQQNQALAQMLLYSKESGSPLELNGRAELQSGTKQVIQDAIRALATKRPCCVGIFQPPKSFLLLQEEQPL